jgi:hypothetical protein
MRGPLPLCHRARPVQREQRGRLPRWPQQREVGEHGLMHEAQDEKRRWASRARRHDSWRRARPRKCQRTSYLDAIVYGAELCYLGAMTYGVEQRVQNNIKTSRGVNMNFF